MTKADANAILTFVAEEILSPIAEVNPELWERLTETPFNKLVELTMAKVHPTHNEIAGTNQGGKEYEGH